MEIRKPLSETDKYLKTILPPDMASAEGLDEDPAPEPVVKIAGGAPRPVLPVMPAEMRLAIRGPVELGWMLRDPGELDEDD